MKNYKGLASVIVIMPAVSASWQFLKLGFYPPTEAGRYGPIIPDDYISKK